MNALCSFAFFSLLLGLSGCSRPLTSDALVIAQSPRSTGSVSASDALDRRYPRGSRVVIATLGLAPKTVHVLSTGLIAAGQPVISYDGQRIVFAGKIASRAAWQIYEVSVEGGRVRPLTAVPEGAMDPALLPDGSLVFASPVGETDGLTSSGGFPALYVQPPGGKPRQLTFSSVGVADPTVLADGRVLFVSAQPSAAANATVGLALYTINNDGTEVAAFAGQHDEPSLIRRPRQLEDGRIVFLVSSPANPGVSWAEFVRSARPFASRAALLRDASARIRSVQPAPGGDLLVCGELSRGTTSSDAGSAVFRIGSAATVLGAPVLEDPDWNCTEAVQVRPSRRPMGRLSNVDLTQKTGQLLCLDVNDTAEASRANPSAPRPTHIRVFTEGTPGHNCVLGEVGVQADGSFMAEVPADVPLGFEALDERGGVIRRVAPLLWVRPGENRSCIGCHEAHNHSPRNFRPLAVRVPVPRLCGESANLAQNGR